MTSIQRLEDRLTRLEAAHLDLRQVLVPIGGNETPEQKERARLAAFTHSRLPEGSNPEFIFIKTGVHRRMED